MNIKSLLLGSAAALVAVSGARAADAVVIAEPEPMEYVRVCDVYGTGFYYIPGTETCLRIGGYVQYDIGVGDALGITSWDKLDAAEDGDLDENDTYFKRARISLQLDARSETELGTLRGYVEMRFNDDQSTTGAFGFSGQTQSWEVNHGYIELGGFRVGKTDSLFSTFTGYAGNVINDDIAVAYGPFDTNQISYTWVGGNGFSAAIALEEGGGDDYLFDTDGDGDLDVAGDLYTLDSYVPHVVGGLSWTQGWGGISAVVGYDANWEEWAGKVRLDVNATEQLSLWVMAGYKSGADEDFLGVDGLDNPNYYGQWSGDWAVYGGGTYQATEKASINVQLAYDEGENFSAVANVDYTLVPGFRVIPELVYVDNFDDEVGDGDNDAFGGFLRLRRSF
jgi:hypothetical protein